MTISIVKFLVAITTNGALDFPILWWSKFRCFCCSRFWPFRFVRTWRSSNGRPEIKTDSAMKQCILCIADKGNQMPSTDQQAIKHK